MTKKELIIKLTRLANNNPNEHEANSAARRVCQLLAELNFTLDVISPSKQSTVTWNDVKRATEPFWKSRPEPPTNQQEDWFNKYREERERMRNERNPWVYEPTQKQREYFDEFMKGFKVPYTEYRPKERSEQRVRKCVDCGKEELTRRITNVFRCNECEWNHYRKV